MGHDAVQLAAPNRSDERHALDEIVARGGKHPAFWRAHDRVSRSADPLQQRRDPMRRSNLAGEIDVADVDAELQRGGGDERLERAVFQARLRVEPPLFRQAAVMRGHRVFAETVAQMARQPLGQPAGVHEDQRRPVFPHELGEAVVVFLPDLAGHHRFERRLGQLDREIERAPVAFVDDGAVGGGAVAAGGLAADQERRDGFDRRLRRRQADPQQRGFGHLLQAFERQRQVRAAAGANHGVNLVDDHRPRGSQHGPAALGGQQQEQRFRRRDQNVRRRPQHRGALGLRGVAGPHGDRDARLGRCPSLRRTARCPGAAPRGSCGCRCSRP